MLSEEINVLPDRVRRYIAALETECDPAGTIRENFRLREENAGLRIECENLARQVYVPGLWRCLKCEFQLCQATLCATTGTVGGRDEPGDKCPNCNSPLWRVSEREAGNEMVKRCEQLLEDAARLNWLDDVNSRTNERNGTKYGWRFDINHNRAALTDHNYPALPVREAIDAARHKM